MTRALALFAALLLAACTAHPRQITAADMAQIARDLNPELRP